MKQDSDVTNFYFKCKSSEYSSIKKGQICAFYDIEPYLEQYPDDWQKVLPYPTSSEILDCIENGKNKNIIVKALKQWKHQR